MSHIDIDDLNWIPKPARGMFPIQDLHPVQQGDEFAKVFSVIIVPHDDDVVLLARYDSYERMLPGGGALCEDLIEAIFPI